MKPLVENAANESQVKAAKVREKIKVDQHFNDLREVLALASGRRVLWNILIKCKVFESVWDNSARIHFNAGQQDIGHFIMSEIVNANEELLFQMMRENQKENA